MSETLYKIPLFKELLSKDQLQCLPQGTDVWLNPGEMLFKQGEPADYFYVIFEGTVRITREICNQKVVLATYNTGMFFGEVPLLVGTLHLTSGQAVCRSHVYCLKEEDFWQMPMKCPSIRKLVFGFMISRMQELQLLSQQREKLISLGTLAAGFSHELNNPAAAARRSAEQLREPIKGLQAFALRVIEQYLTPDQRECLSQLQHDVIEQPTKLNRVDPLAQNDQENELTDWLEEQGVVNGWKLAPTLVAAGLNPERLKSIGEQMTVAGFSDMIIWLEATLAVAGLLNELEQTTDRISELVQSVKAYSYMGQSPLQDVDMHEGLDNTLTILSYKLKKHNIVVIREYDQSLPRIQAYGSQLNQVWTNLIDNAIDALREGGTIWVRTSSENDCIVVEIVDNGMGIPVEIQPRIFEPFFTTKEVGAGMGLGLEIAYGILVGQHNGDICCFSQPGHTCFRVRLPID